MNEKISKKEKDFDYNFDEKKLIEAKTELELYLKSYDIDDEIKKSSQNIIEEIKKLINFNESKNKKGIKKLLQDIKKTLKVLKDIFLTVDNTARKVNNCLDTVWSGISEVVKKVEEIIFP